MALEIAGAGAWLAYDELLVGAGERLMARPSSAMTFRVSASKGVHVTHHPNARAGIGRPGSASLTFVKCSHANARHFYIYSKLQPFYSNSKLQDVLSMDSSPGDSSVHLYFLIDKLSLLDWFGSAR